MIRDPYGADLVAWGKALALTTTGRRSGRPAVAIIGYVEEADGTLLVAAGSPGANWAANLQFDPACRVRLGEATREATAVELDGADKARAVSGLILKYGTPAETLGAGPAFRLRPLGASFRPRP
jgi:deazaflavin-dependent oxidoreductase (nitroreductase family)